MLDSCPWSGVAITATIWDRRHCMICSSVWRHMTFWYDVIAYALHINGLWRENLINEYDKRLYVQMLNSCPWSVVDITATVCDSSASHALQSGDKWHFGMRWCAYIHGFHILWGISYFNKVAFWFVSSSSFVPTCEKWVLQHSPNLHKAGFRALPLSPLAQIWPETLQLSD